MSALEDAITRLLDERGPDKTICPSEAARAVGGSGWRDLMPDARKAAQLAKARAARASVVRPESPQRKVA